MRLIFLFFYLGAQQLVLGQVPKWEMHSFDRDLEIKFLETDDLGFVWVCTHDELFRYDGLRLDSRLKLDVGYFSSINKNKDGIFCLGTSIGSFYLFDPLRNKIKFEIEKSDFGKITGLYLIDNQNYILLSYGSGLLMSLNGKEYKLNTENGLLSNELYDVVLFDDDYYLACDQGIQIIELGFKDFELSTITADDGLPDLVITNLLCIKNELWFSDYKGHVGSINHRNISFFAINEESKIHDLEILDDKIYLANDSGVFCKDSSGWQKKYPINGRAKVTQIVIDNENNLWLQSSKNSVYQGNLNLERCFDVVGSARILFKNENNFLIGKNSGLYDYSTGKGKIINRNNITFIKDFNEYILVGTFSDGVLLYDKKLNILDQKDNWMGVSNQSVLCIYPDDDLLYVSSLSGVMKFQIINSKLVEAGSINQDIGQDYIYTIFKNENDLLFGTDRHGIIKWNLESNQVKKIKTFDDGTKIGSVYSITDDGKDLIWFSSSNMGLGKIDGDRIERAKSIGKTNEEYTSVSKTIDNKLVLVSSSSIDFLDLANGNVSNYRQKTDPEISSEYLNTVFTYLDETYILYDNYVLRYTPFSSISTQPNLVIDQIFVNLSPVENQINFKEDQCNFEFKFTGLWLSDPTSLRYRYKLEGFDDDWRETRNNSVSFTNLAPGRYKFYLQCSRDINYANASTVQFSFEISKHWYNQILVRTLFILISLILLWLFYRNREKQKSEKQALKQLKVENQLINLKSQLNPHFLFNSFNTLIGLIEEDQPKSIEFTERMSDFYRRILDMGNFDLVSLDDELELLRQYLGILKTRFSGQLKIEMNLDSVENHILPPFSLQMLIENAVKHNIVSTKNPLKIRIKKDGDLLSIWNQKNTISSSDKGTNTGLKNIKNRFLLAGMYEPIIKDCEDSFEVILNLSKK